jgi:hypothetical protein
MIRGDGEGRGRREMIRGDGEGRGRREMIRGNREESGERKKRIRKFVDDEEGSAP